MKLGPKDDDTSPVIDPGKKTTQVNFTIVAGVLLFLLAGALTVSWLHMFHHR